MADSGFSVDNNFQIRNGDVAVLLFMIFNHFELDDQNHLISTFIRIVRKSSYNKTYCCSINLVGKLLDLVPKIANEDIQGTINTPLGLCILARIIHLIELLGAHNITVSELKKFFSLLKSEVGDFRVCNSSNLLIM